MAYTGVQFALGGDAHTLAPTPLSTPAPIESTPDATASPTCAFDMISVLVLRHVPASAVQRPRKLRYQWQLRHRSRNSFHFGG